LPSRVLRAILGATQLGIGANILRVGADVGLEADLDHSR